MNSWFQPRTFILIAMLGLRGTLLKTLDISFYSVFMTHTTCLPYTLNQTINNNFSLVNRILAAAQVVQ